MQQRVYGITSGESDWGYACRWQMNIMNTCCELVKRVKKILTHKLQLFCKKTFLYQWFCNFHGLEVFQGKASTLNRWSCEIKPPHHSMAHLLSNNCTKYYLNWTIAYQIIVGGWVVYYFSVVRGRLYGMHWLWVPVRMDLHVDTTARFYRATLC